jgi:L-alanine-DL-glutamate epimerase-like enolase superfamily enzyme
MKNPKITDIRAFVVQSSESGGDYMSRGNGHWIVDSVISNPMSIYPEYRQKRSSWGIGVLGSIVVEIETDEGHIGISTGLGGEPACFLIEKHFRRFLIGQDPRDINRMWDQMFRASLPYGRKGLALIAISAVDIALWDVLGLLHHEPVYKLIGGATRASIPLYCTGPQAATYQQQGFLGAKLPLPYGPADGVAGLRKNTDVFMAARQAVGPDFLLMVDCYMSLDVPYTIDLAKALAPADVHWIEEPLQPDDFDGHQLLKSAVPTMRWATGEHEYTRYGFRKLIESRAVDVLQPDLMWVGGLTETLRIAAMAGAYDIPVVPHGSGAYSYHFVMSQPQIPFCEYVNTSLAGDKVSPVFGSMFTNEILPVNGQISLSEAPGWGLTLDRAALQLKRPYVSSDSS